MIPVDGAVRASPRGRTSLLSFFWLVRGSITRGSCGPLLIIIKTYLQASYNPEAQCFLLWFFAQLIYRPMGAKIQLCKHPNISKLGIFYRLCF